jgi:tRNA threonylcarbamoyladenosine biosynthesis protein TsaB
MKILTIETSGPLCGVALSDEENIIAEISKQDGNIHDKLCAHFVKTILDENKLSVSDLDAVALSAGPGSFTGLRIGASIAKALCFKENDKDISPKLIAVPTLSAFANSAVEYAKSYKSQKIISANPAQKDLFYYQEFDINSNETSEIQMIEKDGFNKMDFSKTFLCGPYFINSNITNTKPEINNYSVEIIAEFGIKMYKEKKFTDAAKFKPDYIQDFQIKTKKKSLNI